jgi:hypothetical protein
MPDLETLRRRIVHGSARPLTTRRARPREPDRLERRTCDSLRPVPLRTPTRPRVHTSSRAADPVRWRPHARLASLSQPARRAPAHAMIRAPTRARRGRARLAPGRPAAPDLARRSARPSRPHGAPRPATRRPRPARRRSTAPRYPRITPLGPPARRGAQTDPAPILRRDRPRELRRYREQVPGDTPTRARTRQRAIALSTCPRRRRRTGSCSRPRRSGRSCSSSASRPGSTCRTSSIRRNVRCSARRGSPSW